MDQPWSVIEHLEADNSKHNTQFNILSSAINYNNIVRKIK